MKPPVGYHRVIRALTTAVHNLVALETLTLTAEQRAQLISTADKESTIADADLSNIEDYLARHRVVTTPKPKAQKRGRKP